MLRNWDPQFAADGTRGRRGGDPCQRGAGSRFDAIFGDGLRLNLAGARNSGVRDASRGQSRNRGCQAQCSHPGVTSTLLIDWARLVSSCQWAVPKPDWF